MPFLIGKVQVSIELLFFAVFPDLSWQTGELVLALTQLVQALP